MTNLDLLAMEAMCAVLRRIALQYDDASEERIALRTATAALLSQAVENGEKHFEDFCRDSEHYIIDEKVLSEWIACHPEASAGTTTVIGARLHVVTSDRDGQMRLVPVQPVQY